MWDDNMLPNQLENMTTSLKELQHNIRMVLKKDGIKQLITSTVNKVMQALEKKMEGKEQKIKENTNELQEKPEFFELENKLLKTKNCNLQGKCFQSAFLLTITH